MTPQRIRIRLTVTYRQRRVAEHSTTLFWKTRVWWVMAIHDAVMNIAEREAGGDSVLGEILAREQSLVEAELR
jgi:hypothetical protein